MQAVVFDALQFSEDYIAGHPVAGRAAFIALAACSALLLLFSSVALVRIGVNAWGQLETATRSCWVRGAWVRCAAR